MCLRPRGDPSTVTLSALLPECSLSPPTPAHSITACSVCSLGEVSWAPGSTALGPTPRALTSQLRECGHLPAPRFPSPDLQNGDSKSGSPGCCELTQQMSVLSIPSSSSSFMNRSIGAPLPPHLSFHPSTSPCPSVIKRGSTTADTTKTKLCSRSHVPLVTTRLWSFPGSLKSKPQMGISQGKPLLEPHAPPSPSGVRKTGPSSRQDGVCPTAQSSGGAELLEEAVASPAPTPPSGSHQQ